MGLSVALEELRPTEVFGSNITHNLRPMAAAARIDFYLWDPASVGCTKALDLIQPLTDGLATLKAEPARFRALNSENGWGRYEDLLGFVAGYLAACRENPEASVSVCR